MPSTEMPDAPKPRRSGALSVTAGILASRLVGLARQRVVAHFLGTSDAADALAAAFRVGNITQNLLGEGALSASFIPVYARLRSASTDDARRFAWSSLALLGAAALALSALGVALAAPLTRLIAFGFPSDKLAETTALVRIVFPMTGLLVVAAWALGVLSAHRRFLLPYAAPVVWNLAQIAAVMGAGAWLSATGLAAAQAVVWGALAGAALQLALTTFAAVRSIGGAPMRPSTEAPGVKEAAARLPAAIMGRGVVQISGLVDTLLVSFLGTGANAVFQYAQTLYLLPMSLLGVGESAAALPELAEKASGEDGRAEVRRALETPVARVVLLAALSAAGLAVFGREVVDLLLRTGSFDSHSAREVAAVLSAYALALPANAAARLLATACFAFGDTKRPATFATIRVVVSTAGSVALMSPLGVRGVVLGAVLAAWVELGLLAHTVRRQLDGLPFAKVAWLRIAVACGATLGTGLAARQLPLPIAIAPLVVLSTAAVGGLAAIRWLGLGSLRSLLRR